MCPSPATLASTEDPLISSTVTPTSERDLTVQMKQWHWFPREVVDVSSLETFQVRLDGALSNVVWLKMSLLTAGVLGWMTSKGPFQCKPFYETALVNSHFIQGHEEDIWEEANEGWKWRWASKATQAQVSACSRLRHHQRGTQPGEQRLLPSPCWG